jgi:RecA-family ATPase
MSDESAAQQLLEELHWREEIQELLRPPTIIGARATLAAAQLRTDFLIPDAIPAHAITLIIGVPGSGKSWLAYALAMSTMRGDDWLGITPERTGKVLVLNYDNPTPEAGRRFLRLGLEARDEGMFFMHSVEDGALRLPEKQKELLGIAEEIRPTLVIVDSLRQAHTSDENSSQEMAIVMSALKGLAKLGPAVVVVHHSLKSQEAIGVGKARGTGEIPASADAQITLTGDVADWDKHRSWAMSPEEERIGFEVVDRGERTFVNPRNLTEKERKR